MESFRIGVGCVAASVGVVWVMGLVALLVICREDDGSSRWWALKRLAFFALLAPLNLHVLYLGAQHALLVA